jgi:3-methylfumaryl-CoA hydratase
VRHHYSTPRGQVLEERQDIVYRKLEAATTASATGPAAEIAEHTRHVEASPVLLFRYSAITFNGHRIHYDQPYVTGAEGYPGLIFHGPLQATLLLRLATELRHGSLPQDFSFRSVRPLFAGGPVSANARAAGDGTSLWIADQSGSPTMLASC